MVALLWRVLGGVRATSVAQAGRPPLSVMRSHALAPAYPVGHVSSQLLGPRAWARLACAGRAVFLAEAFAGHGASMPRTGAAAHHLRSAMHAAQSPQLLKRATAAA